MRELTGMEAGFVAGADEDTEVEFCEAYGDWMGAGTTGLVSYGMYLSGPTGMVLSTFVAPIAGMAMEGWTEFACSQLAAGVDTISADLSEYAPFIVTNPYHHQPHGSNTY